jgi:hypothetical protein
MKAIVAKKPKPINMGAISCIISDSFLFGGFCCLHKVLTGVGAAMFHPVRENFGESAETKSLFIRS